MSIKDSRKEALRLRATMQERQREIDKAVISADDYARHGDMRGAERAQGKIRQLTEEMIGLENAALVAEHHAHDQVKRIKDIEAREKLVKAEYEQKMRDLEHERSEIIGGMTNMY